MALQVLGDLVGLGVNYFDTDNMGYVKTAAEVSSDNSALMRNIRRTRTRCKGRSWTSRVPLWPAAGSWVWAFPRRATWASYATTPSSRARPPRSSRAWPRSQPSLRRVRSTVPAGMGSLRLRLPQARTRSHARGGASGRHVRLAGRAGPWHARPVAAAEKKSFSPYSEPLSSAVEPSSFSFSSFSHVDMALICPSLMSRASASLKAKSRSSSCPA